MNNAKGNIRYSPREKPEDFTIELTIVNKDLITLDQARLKMVK